MSGQLKQERRVKVLQAEFDIACAELRAAEHDFETASRIFGPYSQEACDAGGVVHTAKLDREMAQHRLAMYRVKREWQSDVMPFDPKIHGGWDGR